MRTADAAIAYMDRGHDDLVRREPVHQHHHRSDIRNGIHRANLMEMDIGDRHSMDMALRLSDQAEDGEDIILQPLRNGKMI